MEAEYDFSQGKRGLVIPQPGKTRIRLWIDTDVLAAYMAYANRLGENMTPAMNTALRQYIEVLWARTVASGKPPQSSQARAQEDGH